MKRIGLALGGGGARGVAHIAYLKALEEMGVKPSIISGTSSGAMVGAMYAGGLKPDDIYGLLEKMFKRKNRERSNKINFFRPSKSFIVSTARNFLNVSLPKKQFKELDIPLKVVATDFNTLKERVFENGNLISAIMASIALPGVFVPQPVGDAFYMDGGATNIVPFDIICDECDTLIAIDVSSVRPNSKKPSMRATRQATWAATHEALIMHKLEQCKVDIFERPEFQNVSTMQFYKHKHIYEKAEEYIPEFKKKLEKIL